MDKLFCIILLILVIVLVGVLVFAVISEQCWVVTTTEMHTATITKMDYSTEGRRGNFDKFIATIHYENNDIIIELNEYDYAYYQVGNTITLKVNQLTNSLTNEIKYVYEIEGLQ